MKYKYSVITCNFDDYEIIREIENPSEDIEYIYVTNNKNATSKTWKIVYDEYYNTISNSFDKVVEFRKKVLNYCSTNICCRIDGSIKISGNAFDATIKEFNKNNCDISFIIHPCYRNVCDEYKVWSELRSLDENVCNRTIEYMVNKGYNVYDNNIYTLGILIQRKNEKNTLLNQKQYEELTRIKDYSKLPNFDRCDQAVFTYVLDSYFNDMNVLPLHYSILERGETRLYKHKDNNVVIIQKNTTFQRYYKILDNKFNNRIYNGNKWLYLLTNNEIYSKAKKILLKTPDYVYENSDINIEHNKNTYNVLRYDCDVVSIGSSDPKDFYFSDLYNKHYFKMEWYYNKLLPIIESQLEIKINLDDFKKVTCEDKFCYVPKKEEYYDVYCPKLKKNKESGYVEVYFTLNDLYQETSNSIVYPESVFMNVIPNWNDSFHRIFKYSHLSCKIKNYNAVTEKTLLLICDSHTIPFISILAHYYKTLIIIDNRLTGFNFDFLYAYEDIDNIMIIMSYDNDVNKFLNNTDIK